MPDHLPDSFDYVPPKKSKSKIAENQKMKDVPPSTKITGTPKGKKYVDFSLHEKAE